MSTVAQLIDRTYRDWLRPTDRQPIATKLTTANVTVADGQTVNYDANYLGPDEEDLIAPGLIVELFDSSTGNNELARVATATPASDLFTITDRGLWGTIPSAFTFANSATDVILDPPPPRVAVFDAIADALYGLYPELFLTKTYDIGGRGFQPPDDYEEHIDLWTQKSGQWVRTGFREAQSPYGVWIYPNRSAFGRFRYKARFTRPSAESDDLTDASGTWGIPAAWQEALIIEAAGTIMAAADIPAADAEVIVEQLAAQAFPVRSGESVSRALLRLRDAKVARWSQQLHRSLPRGVSVGGVRIK